MRPVAPIIFIIALAVAGRVLLSPDAATPAARRAMATIAGHAIPATRATPVSAPGRPSATFSSPRAAEAPASSPATSVSADTAPAAVSSAAPRLAELRARAGLPPLSARREIVHLPAVLAVDLDRLPLTPEQRSGAEAAAARFVSDAGSPDLPSGAPDPGFRARAVRAANEADALYRLRHGHTAWVQLQLAAAQQLATP